MEAWKAKQDIFKLEMRCKLHCKCLTTGTNYWEKQQLLHVCLLISRVDAFLEDMLSPNTNYQPPHKWKSMKWNTWCSTKGPSIQCLHSSGLELFNFAKQGFSTNQKGSKLKNVNRRDFQTQNVETLFHTLLADYAISCWVLGLSMDATCKVCADHSSGLIVGFQKNCWLCANPDPL